MTLPTWDLHHPRPKPLRLPQDRHRLQLQLHQDSIRLHWDLDQDRKHSPCPYLPPHRIDPWATIVSFLLPIPTHTVVCLIRTDMDMDMDMDMDSHILMHIHNTVTCMDMHMVVMHMHPMATAV